MVKKEPSLSLVDQALVKKPRRQMWSANVTGTLEKNLLKIMKCYFLAFCDVYECVRAIPAYRGYHLLWLLYMYYKCTKQNLGKALHSQKVHGVSWPVFCFHFKQ